MAHALTDLFTLADAYVAATGLSESTLSGLVLKGGNRLRDLRAGKADIGVRRLDTAIAWFSNHWPANLAWPESVRRPEPVAPSPAAPVPTEAAT